MQENLMKKLHAAHCCSKVKQKVDDILSEIEDSKTIQDELTPNQLFVMRKFLMKERGCIEGITQDLLNKCFNIFQKEIQQEKQQEQQEK